MVKSVDDKLRKSLQNRVTAALVTAGYIYLELFTEEKAVNAIDESKVRRENQNLMKNFRKYADEKYQEEDIKCIFFDGRKNFTNVLECDENTGKYYQSRVKMEHIVVVSEPGGEYLFHFVPPSATKEEKAAKQVAKKIVELIEKYDVGRTIAELEKHKYPSILDTKEHF